MDGADDERVPVIAAVGQVTERDGVVTAMDLLERAGRSVLDQAPRLRVNRLSVVGALSPVGVAPASVLATRLGVDPPVRETTTIGGNTPQWLVNRAAADIAAGAIDATLITGAEAMRSGKLGHRDIAASEAVAADVVVGDARPGVGPAEMAVGLVLPVHIYAMIESVLAWRGGRKPGDQRAVLGQLLAPFTAVASDHPFAWFPQERSAAELSEPSRENRVVAEPYTKRMCAFLGVDQAAALLVCSLAVARRAGISDQSIFVWSGADAADVWFPAARPDLASSPGIAAAAQATLGAGRVGVDEVDHLDLYSCFPAPVEMACDALGLAWDDRRGLTVTGGLAAFGGPGNNYTTHAIATMVERLRDRPGLGLVGGLGWYVTKHSYGLYGSEPSSDGFSWADTRVVQAGIDATAVAVLDEPLARPATAVVEASTVTYDADLVSSAPVFARLDDGRRVVAAAEAAEMDALRGTSLVGARITIAGSPPTYKLEATT